MDSLPVFLKLDGRPVILLGEGAVADAKARLLGRAGAVIVRDEDANAPIAIVAIEDEDAAKASVARLKARGVLVNAVDRPSLCDFTLPAIVDRSPVVVAIGTSGASASLAKALRQWLERMLPAGLGEIAAALKAARSTIALRMPKAGARRSFLDDLLSPGGRLDPLGNHPSPADRIAEALDGTDAGANAAQIHELTLTSSDPDDLTLREARLLAGADRVYYTPDVPVAIIDRARADADRIETADPPEILPAGRSVFLKWAAP